MRDPPGNSFPSVVVETGCAGTASEDSGNTLAVIFVLGAESVAQLALLQQHDDVDAREAQHPEHPHAHVVRDRNEAQRG